MYPDVTIVLYHDIAETVHPLAKQLNVSIDPDTFRQHVRYLVKNYDPVSATELLSGNLPRKPLLITFDDAYRSVLEYGADILRESSAPALFFVTSVPVVSCTVPLDNVISLAVEECGIDRVLALLRLDGREISSTPELITAVVPVLQKPEIDKTKEILFSEMGVTEAEIYRDSRLFLDAADLGKFREYGVGIGNHSMHHFFFRCLSNVELYGEICENRDLLERISGQPVDCLGIPYGDERDATAPVLRMARASGHRGIFLVHGRSNRFRPAGDVYYRIDPGNAPACTLRRKLGLEPWLRTLRDFARHRRFPAAPDGAVAPAGGAPKAASH